nr:phage minor tail protein G [Escherichia coli]
MFLKTESFEHNGVTVTLSELSALQRIEHLALMKRQAEQAESDSNRKFTVEDAIRTGAFVVAMSLWHNHPKKTQMPSMNEAVKQIEQEVLTTYSAAIFLIPICISFDTAEKRRYATYLILNRRFSFEF